MSRRIALASLWLVLTASSCARADLPSQPSSSASAAGTQMGPPPHAVLSVRSGIPGTEWLFVGWEATFDAVASTGDGLSYLIEFGDGESASVRRIQHALTIRPLNQTARLTVVDRFGRTDVATQSYTAGTLGPTGLPGMPGIGYVHRDVNPLTGLWEERWISFDTQSGSRVTGFYLHNEGTEYFRSILSGTLSGANRIHLTTRNDTIELDGTYSLEFAPGYKYSDFLALNLQGGTANGRLLRFSYYDP